MLGPLSGTLRSLWETAGRSRRILSHGSPLRSSSHDFKPHYIVAAVDQAKRDLFLGLGFGGLGFRVQPPGFATYPLKQLSPSSREPVSHNKSVFLSVMLRRSLT